MPMLFPNQGAIFGGAGAPMEDDMWTYEQTITTTGGSQIDIAVAGHKAVLLVIRDLSLSSAGRGRFRFSPDDGTTVRDGASDYRLWYVKEETATASLADTAYIDIAVGDTTGKIEGFAEFFGLDVAQRTQYRTQIWDPSGDAVRRAGYLNIAEVTETLLLIAEAGTFDAMAIDVYTA